MQGLNKSITLIVELEDNLGTAESLSEKGTLARVPTAAAENSRFPIFYAVPLILPRNIVHKHPELKGKQV